MADTSVTNLTVPRSILNIAPTSVTVKTLLNVLYYLLTVTVAVDQHHRICRVHRWTHEARDQQNQKGKSKQDDHNDASCLVLVISLYCCEEHHNKRGDDDIAEYLRGLYGAGEGVGFLILFRTNRHRTYYNIKITNWSLPQDRLASKNVDYRKAYLLKGFLVGDQGRIFLSVDSVT